MTDDIVARLPADAAARRLPEFIKTLRTNRSDRRESVYASDNVYALLDALDTAEARVREFEAEVDALRHDLERQMTIANVECDRAETAKARLSTVVSETIEQCAKMAAGCDLPERDWMPGSLYDKIRREVAAAIRSMRKEER